MDFATEDLVTGYGRLEVLRGVTLALQPGRIHVLVGHNGAGKTTLLRSAIGQLPAWSGRVRLGGADVTSVPPAQRIRQGMSLVPQERGIFPSLTVRENLRLGLYLFPGDDFQTQLDLVRETFPEVDDLLDRPAGALSGGQQRICAIARALMHPPEVLLLDEPSVGLSPRLVDRVMQAIRNINERYGLSILLVEQNIRKAVRIAHTVHVLGNGRLILEEPAEDFGRRENLFEFF